MQASINIGKPVDIVFNFISNGVNDPKWRTEVERMKVNGAPTLGTTWMEYSTFFKWFHIVTPTAIMEFTYPKRIVLETPKNHLPWLRSIREVEAINREQSRFTYELSFDVDLTKQIMPIAPPVWFITLCYMPRIRKYLRNLKKLIES